MFNKALSGNLAVENSYPYIINGQGDIIYHADESMLGVNIADNDEVKLVQGKQESSGSLILLV
ncbi:MAG: hypothetical protein ACOZCL_01865 [Bacillota bacterium]